MSLQFDSILILEVLIVVHKWKSILGTFDIDTPAKLQHVLQLHDQINSNTSITVHTGPGHYTTSRKGIAIALACFNVKQCKLHGFNILTDFLSLFGSNCFYREGKTIWTYDNKTVEMHQASHICLNSNFIGNTNLCNNEVIDCSIENVWNSLNQIKTDILQPTYHDKFTKV